VRLLGWGTMSKREELVPEIGGGESDQSGDAESPRQLTDQREMDDNDIDSCTGTSTTSRTIFSGEWGWAKGKTTTKEKERSGDLVKDLCRSTGGGASFCGNIAYENIAPRKREGVTVDFLIERGDPPIEGRDIDAGRARMEADPRTMVFFNTQEMMAEMPTSDDFSKKAVDDAAGCMPGEDMCAADDSPREPGNITGDAVDAPSAKEDSSNNTAGEPGDNIEETAETEIHLKEEAANFFLTYHFPIKPVIAVTQGKAPQENDPKKMCMGNSHDVTTLEVLADHTQGYMADSRMSIGDYEVSSGSEDDITTSSNRLEPETAEQDDVSDDYDFEVFDLLAKRKRKKRKKNTEKSKSLIISIPSHTTKEAVSSDKKTGIALGNEENVGEDKFWPIEDDVLDEEDPLSFYSTTHEGQDPQYVEFQLSMMKNRLQAQLVNIQKDKKEDMEKIQAYLSSKWEESNAALQEEIRKIRFEIVAKQTRQRNQLTDKHKGQREADEQKLNEGENWLLQKQHLETQQMFQHAGRLDWNDIAAQLQNRHAYQRQQFEERKVEMKKRSEQDILTQNQILEAHHKKRNAESQLLIKELTDKCHTQHDNLKAKLLTRHEKRFEQKRNQAEANFGGSQSDTLTREYIKSNQSYLRTSEKSNDGRQTKGGSIEGAVSHDAAMRQKQRKGLMNNASIQLAIEIHNEGKS
jgi:hypothetical protein